jgi:hypothetical protein
MTTLAFCNRVDLSFLFNFDQTTKTRDRSNIADPYGKFAQCRNPVAKPSNVSLCRRRVIFSDKIADLDKVRFCLSG